MRSWCAVAILAVIVTGCFTRRPQLVVTSSTYAEVNNQQPPCEAFSQSKAVFVGVAGQPVVRKVDLPNQPAIQMQLTPMAVKRTYSGVTNRIMWLTPLGVQEYPTPGQRYLVYGREYSAPGIVMASPGVGAEEIESAVDDTSRITVMVRDAGCASKTIDAVINGRVRGVLRGPDGRPLTSTSVDLVPMDNKPGFTGHVQGAGSVSTNDRGEFEFTGRAAGRYYLGLSLYNAPNPFGPSSPRTYYPGTLDRNTAVPVTVGHEGTSASFDFAVPFILSKGEAEITVDTGHAGGDIAGCMVELEDLVSRRRSFDAKAGVAVVMPVVEGSRYHFHAHLKYPGGHLESEPYEFTATTGRHSIVLRTDAPRTLH